MCNMLSNHIQAQYSFGKRSDELQAATVLYLMTMRNINTITVQNDFQFHFELVYFGAGLKGDGEITGWVSPGQPGLPDTEKLFVVKEEILNHLVFEQQN